MDELFEDDVVDILKRAHEVSMEEKQVEIAYRLIPPTERIVAVPVDRAGDPDDTGDYAGGAHWISEMPKKGVAYYQAIGGTGSGGAGYKKGSRIGCIIFKGYDPEGGSFTPVAAYCEQPDTIEGGYNNILRQWQFYNQYGDGEEINYEVTQETSDHLGAFLQKHNQHQYIHKRKDLVHRGGIEAVKRGTAVNYHIKDWQTRQANIFLRKHGMDIRNQKVLTHLLRPSTDNAELRDAFLVFMVSIPDFDKSAGLHKIY